MSFPCNWNELLTVFVQQKGTHPQQKVAQVQTDMALGTSKEQNGAVTGLSKESGGNSDVGFREDPDEGWEDVKSGDFDA